MQTKLTPPRHGNSGTMPQAGGLGGTHGLPAKRMGYRVLAICVQRAHVRAWLRWAQDVQVRGEQLHIVLLDGNVVKCLPRCVKRTPALVEPRVQRTGQEALCSLRPFWFTITNRHNLLCSSQVRCPARGGQYVHWRAGSKHYMCWDLCTRRNRQDHVRVLR